MIFTELTAEEFDSFVQKSPQKNYVQSSKMALLKEKQGNKTYFVGVKEGNKIIAETMIFSIRTHFNKYIFYAPRGFLVDYHRIEILDFFTKEIKKYIRSKNGIKLIIDPKEIYQLLDSNGNAISSKNHQAIYNLKKCGYKHFGFNKNFETMQVRFSAIVPVVGTYEKMLQTFTKTTRKHILELKESSIKVRRGGYEDLETMEKLFRYTAENKHFEHKSLSYYQKMYEVMPEIMNIYIASVDFEEEEKMLRNKLELAIEEQENIKTQMKKINIGAKMLQKQKLIEQKIEKIKCSLEKNKYKKKKFGSKLDIGALLSIESGDEYISLTSGMLKEFKEYNPKYAMYNEHIKDAIDKNKKIINFYGISGNLNPNKELYKIYELKKGFNPQIVELIGQFSLPINFYYYLYETISFIKKNLKTKKFK